MDTIDRSSMNDLVQACVVDLVQPAGLEVMLLAVVRPAHRDERVRDEWYVIAATGVDLGHTVVDVRRDALIGRQLAHYRVRHTAVEVQARDELRQPRWKCDVAVRAAGVDERGAE